MGTDISDWKMLKAAAEKAYEDSLFCRAVVEIITQGNAPEVIRAVNADGSGAAVQIFWHSGHIAAHIFLARAVAPIRRGDRHLAAAIEFLRRPLVIEQRPAEKDQECLRTAVGLFDALAKDPAQKRLLHMRHKMLAHWSEQSPNVAPPTYDELYGLVAKVSEIAELVAAGSGAIKWPIDFELIRYRRSASAFWARWQDQNMLPGTSGTGEAG